MPRMGIRLGLPGNVAEPALATRIAWLTGLRLAFLAILLGLFTFVYLDTGLQLGRYSTRIVLGTLGAAFALAGAYAWLLRGGRHLLRLAYAQLVFDQLTWSALISVSGGASSGATAFYGLTCLTGAIVGGLRGAAIAALAGMASYSLLCAAFASGVLVPPIDQPSGPYATELSQMVYPFFLNALVMMVVTLLAGYLAERLRLAGGRIVAATERAEQAERLAALGRLAAGLAHEIRNPLGSIMGSVQLLATARGLDDEERELCNIVERETARLNDLVGDMLQLSRPRQPVLASVDVGRTAREVVELAARSGRGSDVSVRYEGPPEGDRAVVEADAGQLRQVVWNLVRNAVQASSPGDPVVVKVERSQRELRLEVHDNGEGIAPEARSLIFDASFTTRSSGMGIGLAVVKRIVDDHGWHIDVESREGSGATFRVKMPLPSAAAA